MALDGHRLGVGIIGAGWWAGEHARAVAAVPEARLLLFASRDPDRRAAFERDHAIPGCDDYRRLLERPEVEAVAIAVPHDAHAEIAIAALAAGKHVLLEKPMAPTWAECTAIAAAARQSMGRFMLGLTHHFIPTVAATQAIVQRGDLGRIVSALQLHTQTWDWRRRPAFYRDRALGGGIWLTLGVHFVDRLLWLLPAPMVAVQATIGRRFHTPLEQPADDAVSAQARFADGATATIILAGYHQGPAVSALHLIGERGGLRLDEHGLAIGLDPVWRSLPVATVNPMQAEWRAFVAAIQRGEPMPVSLDHALQVMAVLFAAEAAAASGQEQPVTPPGWADRKEYEHGR